MRASLRRILDDHVPLHSGLGNRHRRLPIPVYGQHHPGFDPKRKDDHMGTARGVQLTRDGQKRLEEELRHLTEVRIPELTERIQQATEDGDVSDNSEYEDLKEEYNRLEGRLHELENILENVVIIEEGSRDGTIHIGSHVTVRTPDDSEDETWVLVGPEEAHAPEGRISSESPVGQALLGSRAGDSITVTTPGGHIVYTVVDVK
jgi:transcription elongation factor GreA